jgi:hypothetical protein
MPQLLIPFEVKGIYLSDNQTITEPSADFSKVSYFDKKKESVINPSMPYISENLVSQPFENQEMTLEKGVHLHFILPAMLRSDVELANNNHELPPIPNRWLIIKNSTEKYIIESDYLFPEYSDLKNKVTVPIPWAKLKEKELNVPFRYMGRQYRIGNTVKKEGEGYWHDVMDEPLTAEGYGEPSFVGFLPNCKNILTFHDATPAAGDTYEIWGWYDLGTDTTDKITALFEKTTATAKEQFTTFSTLKSIIESAKKYEKGDATVLSNLTFSAEQKTLLSTYLELKGEIKTDFLKETASKNSLESVFQELSIKEDISLKIFFEQVFEDAATAPDSFLNSYSLEKRQMLANQLKVDKSIINKLIKKPIEAITKEESITISSALLLLKSKGTFNFKTSLSEFERVLFEEMWATEVIGDYHSTNENSSLFLYNKTKISTLEALNGKQAEIDYDIAVGNSGTEAISAFVADKLAKSGSLRTFEKAHIENVLEAVQFDSLIGSKVDIGSRFTAARHEKTFRAIEGGIKYTFDFEITPASDNLTEEIQAFKKLLRESKKAKDPNLKLAAKVAQLGKMLYKINLLQSRYDKNIRIIQSKRHQLFADWYKYMMSAHPPYMQDKDYPKADDVLRYVYGHVVEDISELVIETGFLVVPADSSIPKILDGIKVYPNSIAQRIVNEFKQFQTLLETLNQGIKTQIQQKIFALQQAKTAYDTSKASVINLKKENPTPEEQTAYLSAIALNGEHKKTLEDLYSFANLVDKKVIYNVKTENGQRYYEANEPILLLGKKGKEADVFDKKTVAYSLETATKSGGEKVLEQQLPLAPADYVVQNAQFSNDWLLLEWEINYRPIDDPSIEGHYKENFIYDNFDIKPDTPDFAPIVSDEKEAILLSNFTRRYTGVTYVSAGTNDVLSQKISDLDLAEYKNIFGKAATILNDYQCFTQTLGGFNQALLMRKQTMQLEVADPIAFEDYQPLIKRIRDFVGDSRKSAPEPKHFFNPIRGGAVEISRLKLVNTFGQAVEIYNAVEDETSKPIIAAETIKLPKGVALPARFEAQADKLIYLPPRFSQPTRMLVDWVGADWTPEKSDLNNQYDANPVCGWVAPNFLENNFFIFDQGGVYLGSIGLIGTEVKLFPKPGENAFYVDEIKNEHLRNFVKYFTDSSLGVDLDYLFTEFKKGIEDSLDYIEPQNYAQFPALSLLAGRPLALVRASFHLELMEDYAVNQDWNIFKKDIQKTRNEKRETYDFEKVDVPIRIGDYDLLNDGVIGFWYKDVGYVKIDEEKEKISVFRANPNTINLEDALYMPLFQKEKEAKAKQAVIGKKKLQDGRGSFLIDQNLVEKPQIITLLLDPRGDMTVTAGVLPVKRVALPPKYYQDVLDKMQLHFLASPIITPYEQLQMPLLNYTNTKWNWVSVERNLISGNIVHEIPATPSITKMKLKRLFKMEIMPQTANTCWNILKTTPWITETSTNAQGVSLYNVGDLEQTVTLGEGFDKQLEGIKTILEILATDSDGLKITARLFESYYIERIASKEKIWDILIKINWLKEMAENEERAMINFDINSREALPKHLDGETLNDLLNTHFDGIGHVNINPQFNQNAIREGWLKMV